MTRSLKILAGLLAGLVVLPGAAWAEDVTLAIADGVAP